MFKLAKLLQSIFCGIMLKKTCFLGSGKNDDVTSRHSSLTRTKLIDC